MTVSGGADEPLVPGEVGTEPHWNESMYVFWRATDGAVSGWTRVAHQPRGGTTSTFACVARRDGLRFRSLSVSAHADRERRGGAWQGSGQRWSWAGDELRISHDAPQCAYDLAWTGFYEPVDFHALMADFRGQLGEINAHHVEQSGRVRGRVRLGDEEHEVDALGHRDHSWGARDTGNLLTSRWLIGTVGPSLSWSGVVVLMADGRVVRTGFVVRDDVVIPATDVQVRLTTLEDGMSFSDGFGRLSLVDGSEIIVDLDDVTAGGILEVQSWIGLESTARARAGGHEGVGNCELSNSITGGRAAPPVLVSGGAIGEGLTRDGAADGA